MHQIHICTPLLTSDDELREMFQTVTDRQLETAIEYLREDKVKF